MNEHYMQSSQLWFGVIELFAIWLVGVFATGSALMFWFNTRLPVHLLQIVKPLLFWKGQKYWCVFVDVGNSYKELPLKLFTQKDFIEWVRSRMGEGFAELAGCPGCLSFHIGLGVSLLSQIALGEFDIYLLVASAVSFPVLGNLQLSILRRK